jgi:hypothetical protein
MTKTQQHLMEMLAKHSGTYSIETCYGRGPQGGKTVTHGARRRDAMFAPISVRVVGNSTSANYTFIYLCYIKNNT